MGDIFEPEKELCLEKHPTRRSTRCQANRGHEKKGYPHCSPIGYDGDFVMWRDSRIGDVNEQLPRLKP